jgi:hypothetical protein
MRSQSFKWRHRVIHLLLVVCLALVGVASALAVAHASGSRYCGTIPYTYQGTTFRDNVFVVLGRISCRTARTVDQQGEFASTDVLPNGWRCVLDNRGLWLDCRRSAVEVRGIPWTGGPSLPAHPRDCGIAHLHLSSGAFDEVIQVLGGHVPCATAIHVDAVAMRQSKNRPAGWQCFSLPNASWLLCIGHGSVFRGTFDDLYGNCGAVAQPTANGLLSTNVVQTRDGVTCATGRHVGLRFGGGGYTYHGLTCFYALMGSGNPYWNWSCTGPTTANAHAHFEFLRGHLTVTSISMLGSCNGGFDESGRYDAVGFWRSVVQKGTSCSEALAVAGAYVRLTSGSPQSLFGQQIQVQSAWCYGELRHGVNPYGEVYCAEPSGAPIVFDGVS